MRMTLQTGRQEKCEVGSRLGAADWVQPISPRGRATAKIKIGHSMATRSNDRSTFMTGRTGMRFGWWIAGDPFDFRPPWACGHSHLTIPREIG
jgi:hypothetical protein